MSGDMRQRRINEGQATEILSPASLSPESKRIILQQIFYELYLTPNCKTRH